MNNNIILRVIEILGKQKRSETRFFEGLFEYTIDNGQGTRTL